MAGESLGLKIAAAWCILSGIVILAFSIAALFLALSPAIAPPENMITLGAAVVSIFLAFIEFILAYLLWKRNRIARYIASLFAVLSIPLGLIILYFLWLDKETASLFP